MHILIFLLALVAIVAIVRTNTPRAAAPSDGSPTTPADEEQAAAGPHDLQKIVSDARSFFASARRETHAEQTGLISAFDALCEQTDLLSERIAADDPMVGALRQPVLRLLLPLNGVARRAAKASHRMASVERDDLLAASAAAIHRAANEFNRIGGMADEAALLRLEADLEVLETQLGDEPGGS